MTACDKAIRELALEIESAWKNSNVDICEAVEEVLKYRLLPVLEAA